MDCIKCVKSFAGIRNISSVIKHRIRIIYRGEERAILDRRNHRYVCRASCREVARPVVFGIGIIMLVYLPILTLRGIEGKMFRPMAWAVIFSLGTALILALTLMPALTSIK